MKNKQLHTGFGGMLFLFLFAMAACGKTDKEELAASPFLNLHDSVSYVGMQTCVSCHANVHETFKKTGMGRSFGRAERSRSDAVFGPEALVYDTAADFFYHPYWDRDTLKVLEYRLGESGDTVHRRVEAVDYIIGSGQHTNSHMMQKNGYLFQVPVTYYTQKKIWDMAPGFRGTQSRFGRAIGMECLSCHNALPKAVPGSENKYERIPLGIDCERCHGPGSLHVGRIRAGKFTDTSMMADYSIVNPARLPVPLQMDLCQRCHLQGVAVLNEGKRWEDFRPGMRLSDFAQVFLPRFEGARDPFLMASQAERLRQSLCYKEASLSCITCHHPHISVKETGRGHFIKACLGCHQSGADDGCGMPLDQRLKSKNNDCIDCHMKQSGSVDIPHVAITDHRISVPSAKEEEAKGELRFVRLENLSAPESSPLTMARGFLRLYEGFGSHRAYLDSAAHYLALSKRKESGLYFRSMIHLYYLKRDYPALAAFAEAWQGPQTDDAYSAFRISEAFAASGRDEEALIYASEAVKRMPLQAKFRNRYASLLLKNARIDEAEKQLRFLLSEEPWYLPALANLGTICLNTEREDEGRQLLLKALALDPDYDLAYRNLIQYYLSRNLVRKAVDLAEIWLRKQPGNKEALEWIEKLKLKK